MRSTDPLDVRVGDRMIGASLHFLGDQAGAREHIDRMLLSYVTPVRRSHTVRFQFNQIVTANITLTRILWLQGYVEQARNLVESNIHYALSIDHTLSLCNALAQSACPVAILSGDLSAAERFVDLLVRHTEGNQMDGWEAYGRACQAVLLTRRGVDKTGLALLRRAIVDLREAHFVQYQTGFLRNLAEAEEEAGEIALASIAIEEALTQTQRTGEQWAISEILRIKGAIILRKGGLDAGREAEALFAESIRLARTQQALAWELRTASSLARLKKDQGRIEEARELLGPIYMRFTEGFETADLLAARRLLDELY